MTGKIPSSHSVSRRDALRTFGLIGTSSLLGCASDSTNASTAADLSALSISTGTLSPAFNATTTTYTLSVSNATNTMTVTPSVATDATIMVNGSAVASGTASSSVALNVGTNTITIAVTGSDGTSTKVYSIVVTRASVTGVSCVLTPSDEVGPFPLAAFLANPAVRRSDVRESKTGVPLTIKFAVVNVSAGCTPMNNVAVYIWSCDKNGEYSGYTQNGNGSHAGETYLRGVQTTDANGEVTFVTIFPGWYSGRITHIHVELFLQDNIGGAAKAATQVCFPPAVTAAVYNSSLYASHGQNTSVASIAADHVFSDGYDYQLVNMTGDVSNGYLGMLTIGING